LLITTLTALVSWIVGYLSQIPLIPGAVIRVYVWWYQVDLSEVKEPIDSFKHLRDFFTRELKEGSRPPLGSCVSPVDGTLRQSFLISEDVSLEVKGTDYNLIKLLHDENALKRFSGGALFHFYLSPRDYHRVHVPCSSSLTAATYIPGRLLPVNPLFCSLVPDLFVTNERLVMSFELETGGEVAVVMVGALNVGAMQVPFDKTLIPKSYWSSQRAKKVSYDNTKQFSIGDHIGTFALGSSVILILSPEALEQFPALLVVGEPEEVKVGYALHN
jgi:phosphatidylserine decarboxylase